MADKPLVALTVKAAGLTQVKADEVVNAILDEMKMALQRGDADPCSRGEDHGKNRTK